MSHLKAVVFTAAVLAATAVQAADIKAGKEYFATVCKTCHSAETDDDGGAQGPNLYGLIGRTAGKGDKTFGYTKAIKASGVVWDAAALDKFLTNPPALIRGTAMVEIVGKKDDRDNLIAYFQSLPKP